MSVAAAEASTAAIVASFFSQHVPAWKAEMAQWKARGSRPDALVIDEGVTMGALPDKPSRST